MFYGDDRFGNMVNVVTWSDPGDEITVQAIRGRQTTFKRGINGTGLHGVGDVDVGDLHPP